MVMREYTPPNLSRQNGVVKRALSITDASQYAIHINAREYSTSIAPLIDAVRSRVSKSIVDCLDGTATRSDPYHLAPDEACYEKYKTLRPCPFLRSR